jgi:xylulokinase
VSGSAAAGAAGSAPPVSGAAGSAAPASEACAVEGQPIPQASSFMRKTPAPIDRSSASPSLPLPLAAVTTADPRAFLALDLGTSAAKAGVVALDGRLRGDARAPYPLLLDGEPGCAEQDPDAWWDALCHAAAIALAQAAADGPLEPVAVCCVGQGPTLVPTAADGRAVGNAVTWLDRRSGAESAAVAAALGRHGWTVTLLGSTRRLSAASPEVASRAAWFLSAWDHIALRLTGVAAAALQDPADAVSAEDARLAGLDARSAPPGVRAGSVLGGLLAGPAAELGLRAGLPVVAGVNDAIATFLGAGLTVAGQAIDTGGTSGGFGLYVATPVAIPPLWTGAAPLPGLSYVGGAMAGTGKALDWFVADALGGAALLTTLLAEAAPVPAGSEGLVFLPYLAGERWPLHDPSARGAFVGLTLHHGRGHLARAVLEAAAYAVRHVAAPALRAGLPFTELRVTGGTAASRLWNGIKADVLNVEVGVPAVTEASLIGAAILAAAGVGAHPDLRAGIDAMVHVAERIAPDPAAVAAYDRVFAVYEELHARLAPANEALGALDPRGMAAMSRRVATGLRRSP